MFTYTRPLRVFKHEGVFLSTFEENPSRDPDHVGTLQSSGEDDDNLFPSELPPARAGHRSTNLEDSGRQSRWGYPICWSKANYEWYPYLPAVMDWRYPIFRGMSRFPEIQQTSSGFKLKDEEIKMWQNVEFVMTTVTAVLFSRQNVPLLQLDPAPPSKFGYARTHWHLKFARKAVIKSRNAFHRLLGFCAYAKSGALSLEALGPHATFYSDRWVSDLYKELDSKDPNVHILTKLLLSSLWKMRASRNYAGIVLSYGEKYDLLSVSQMSDSDVPVYVAWPGPGENPYRDFHQRHHLDEFIPTREHFTALEEPPTLQAAAAPIPATTTAKIRYGAPSAPSPTSQETYDHPMDYVRARFQKVQQVLKESPDRRRMLDRLHSALKASTMGSGNLYQFDHVMVAEAGTGLEKQRWVRILLTRADAMKCFEDAQTRELWFDCVSNQWNHSEHLNIKANVPSTDPEPLSHQSDEEDMLEFHDMEEAADVCLALKEGESVGSSGELMEEDPAEQSAHRPRFDDQAFLLMLEASQFLVSSNLVAEWSSAESFLYGRFGLTDYSGQIAYGLTTHFARKIGLHKAGDVDLSVMELFESFTANSGDLPTECDLSPNHQPTEGQTVLSRSPSSLLSIRTFQKGYIVTVNDGPVRPWKLFIKDPLTVLQIEREQLHSAGGLVSNLIRKGLPFRILYPSCQRGTAFYPHPGPIVHPENAFPTIKDYLAYRLDVADFFEQYPHAYAASLCAGGIFWRIAVDAMPLPAERSLARPFHPTACKLYIVDGERYWSPKLTEEEKAVVVGVFKWADTGQSPKHDSWWPKRTFWKVSGLNFGAWAPADEEWYTHRKEGLIDGSLRATQANTWKSDIKFERRATEKFLSGARAVAKSFIEEHRL